MLKKALRFIFSKINYYYQFISVFQHPTKKVLTPGFLIQFNTPEKHFLSLCAQSFNFIVDYSNGYRQKENYVITLSNCVFLGNSGGVVQDGKVVVESVFDQLRLTKSPAFRSPALMLPKKKNGIYCSVMHLPWAEKSNYHWFLDCLPRLWALQQHVQGPVNLIVPQDMPKYQQETLQFVLKGNSFFKLVTIAASEKWLVSKFILPAFVSNHYSGFLPHSIADFLRTNIWQGYQVKQSKGQSRIYISRAKASKRQLVNEAEVASILKGYGFTILYAEDYSYQEQVNIFYSAEIVVGVHGAGLTNILFGRKMKVLEFHAADLVRSHYFMIAKALNFEYSYLLGSASDHNQNFSIDISNLKQEVETLLNG